MLIQLEKERIPLSDRREEERGGTRREGGCEKEGSLYSVSYLRDEDEGSRQVMMERER